MKKLFFVYSIFAWGLSGCVYNFPVFTTFGFNYGPPLEYVGPGLNQEVYNSELDSLLEYVYTFKNGKRDSLVYEWYSNRLEKNNINISVLEIKNGLYYHDDTLYSGNVFHSNYNVINVNTYPSVNYLLDSLIKRDFIVRAGEVVN